MNQLTSEKQEELLSLFRNVPIKNQTLEMCEVAIEKDGLNIQYVSKRLISEELCIKAIKNNLDSFFLIGKEQMTKAVVLALFEKAKEVNAPHHFIYDVAKKFNRFKGLTLKDLIDEEIAKTIVSCRGGWIHHLPESYKRNVGVISIAIRTDGDMIRYLPEGSQTKELVMTAIEGGVEIELIEKHFLDDDEVVDALVKKSGLNILKVPEDKQTYERYLLALQSRLDFSKVPSNYYSQELFKVAIENDGSCLSDIPKEFVTREMILNAAKTSERGFLFLSEELIDEELAYELVRQGVSLEHDCIRKRQSQRIVDTALERDEYEVEFVNSRFLSKEKLAHLINQRPRVLNLLPKELVDEELCYLAVCNGLTLYDECIAEHQSERIIDRLIEKEFFKVNPRFISNRIKPFVPIKKEFLTKEFFKRVLKQSNFALDFAPAEVIDEELCYLAACEGLGLDCFYMKKHQSQRIVNKAFEMGHKDLEHVNEEFMTKELIEDAMNHSTSIQHTMALVPDRLLSEELCYLYVCKRGTLGHYRLDSFQSKRVVEKAFELDKNEYEFIKEEFKTEEMSKEAFEFDKSLVYCMPERFTTHDMWVDAICSHPEHASFLLDSAPSGFFANDVAIKLVKHDWELVKEIPNEYRTLDVLMAAYEQNEKALKYFNF